ncbi:hypothetical protein P2318_19930 [Myxococcaceae bacterium GXIMD 01537]
MATPRQPAQPNAPMQPVQPQAPAQVKQPVNEATSAGASPGVPEVGALGEERGSASAVVGETVDIKATVPSDKNYTLDIFADAVDARDLNKTTGQIARLGSVPDVRGEVVFRWKVTPLGVPVVRLRFEVRAADKLLERRLSTVVWLFDWVDWVVSEPDYVDPVAREGTPRAEVKVDSNKSPSIEVVQQRPAWADAFGRIEDGKGLVGGATFDAKGKGRTLLPHFADKRYTAQVGHGPIGYASVRKGSSDFMFRTPVAPRTTRDLLLSSRLRLSIWADPALFLVPIENSKKGQPGQPDWVAGTEFTSAAIDAGKDRTDALDDFTMLNVFALRPELTAEEKKKKPTLKRVDYRGNLDATFWKQVVTLCHSKKIQVIAGYVDIINKLSQSRFLTWLDSAARSTKEITDFADELIQFLTDDIPWDGVDFDIEHLPISGGWSAALRRNVSLFFEYLALELAGRNMVVSIAGTTFIDHTHVSPHVPVTGSGTGLPLTLAHLSPNLIYRPMGYDNGFLGKELRNFHRQCTLFALSAAGGNGAGLHPSNFQMGVKIFKGTNNGPKGTKRPDGGDALQGYMTGMPDELRTTCLSVLRPLRTGLILFAWGLQTPGNTPGWDTVVKLDEALNAVEPRDIPDPVDAKALASLVGAQRFPHATLGQPMQGALQQESLDRLK